MPQQTATVYKPREDSFLLANAIAANDIANKVCLDLGTGSGFQTIELCKKGARKVIASDIHKAAIETARTNISAANFSQKVELRQSDLFGNFLPEEKFELIVFNPPYLPSGQIADAATDGGFDGREILDRFLQELSNRLLPNGVCYFLQTDINGKAQTEKALQKGNLKFSIVAEQKLFFEKLLVYRIQKGDI